MPTAIFSTEFGACGLAWNDFGLTSFKLPDPNTEAGTPVALNPLPAWIQDLVARVQHHLTGDVQDFAEVRYDFDRVTAFQQRVYRHTLTVKAGETCSYGEIARALDLPPGGSRAVAAALGDNPWPLLVPCHRVVGADGAMTGFSGPGGVRTKTRLLALEGAQLLSE